VGHSRHQNSGYPSDSRIVEALLTDAAPAVAGIRDPAKIKNLLCLDPQLLELYASRVRNMTAYAKPTTEDGLE